MISLTASTAETLLAHFKSSPPEDEHLVEDIQRSLRFRSDEVGLPRYLATKDLQQILQVCKDVGDRKAVRLLNPIVNARQGESPVLRDLRVFPSVFCEAMRQAWQDGWVYKLDKSGRGAALPAAVTSVRYTPPLRDVAAKVSITLESQSRGRVNNNVIVLEHSDIDGLSIPDILESQGYCLETTQLRDDYDVAMERFHQYLGLTHAQFRLTVPLSFHGGREYDYETVTLHEGQRIVMEDTAQCVGRSALSTDSAVSLEVRDTSRVQIPVLPLMPVFSLDEHKSLWISAERIEPYVYKPELKSQLVLPDTHRDLIDVLAESGDILSEDIIEGKKGGSVILCQGKPGLGKTLTAEIYSEVMQRPLYRVHSGQLGTTAKDVEKKLKEVLERTDSMGLLLLIDEADVLVRERGDNIEQNAITSVFLRRLEYFNSFCFLTTNRPDDIDDAIASRCLAMIKYEAPSNEVSRNLWEVLSAQFGVELDADMISALIERFPALSGRDIKNLLRLVKRYSEARQVAPDIDVFNRCAMFRGL